MESFFIFTLVFTIYLLQKSTPRKVLITWKVIEKVDGMGYFDYTENIQKISPTEARNNSVFIFFYKQDTLNLRHLFDDHVNADMTFKDFIDICWKCWNIIMVS